MVGTAGRAWLGAFLVDYSVKRLLAEEMIMPVKENRNMVIYKQLMYGFTPPWPVLVKSRAAIGILPSPFIEFSRLAASSPISRTGRQAFVC